MIELISTTEPAGAPYGTDPAGWADTAIRADPFPPALDVDAGPPGGGPWVDAGLLGDSVTEPDPPTDPPDALRLDLAAADGDPEAGWAALHGSEDPAVRALARRWQG